MLLRSSSTPVLGSLLPSFSDSPNRDFENTNKYPISSENSNFLKKISFSHGGYSNFSSFSCNSPPIPHSITGFSDSDREFSSPVQRGFRRAQSDGNLEGLAAAAYNVDEFHNSSSASRSYYRKPNTSNLQTIPSFSRYKSKDGFYEEDESDQDEEEEEEEEICERDALLKRSVTIGDSIVAIGGGEFELENRNMGLIEEESMKKFCNFGVNEEEETVNSSLFLARGLGLDMGTGGFGGSGGDFTLLDSGENGRNGLNVEEYYKRMVEENPCNSLFLRNYAQFLYQSKGDLRGAEEYYSRAILADPGDGEILAQYAKLVWELHRDHERASSYFERAIQAAPEESHVLAAYASFLWETEDNEEESLTQDLIGVSFTHEGVIASANA